MNEKQIARFWTMVDRKDAGSCWEWLGSRVPHGYGSFSVSSLRERYAHRVSFILHHGPIPDGQCVCHTCDNRACCNPTHYFLGSTGDNIRDMWAKGRGVRQVKISADDVAAIRAIGSPKLRNYPNIAARYGISVAQVSRIVSGKSR